MEWFDQEIARTKDDLATGKIKHAVLFQHIPWFITSPDEPSEYFNIDMEWREKYLQKLIDAGNELQIYKIVKNPFCFFKIFVCRNIVLFLWASA